MSGMFRGASSFNGDISKWHPSSVISMKDMFRDAKSFKQDLCGTCWVNSRATKLGMFDGSFGSISKTECTTTSNRASSKSILINTPRKGVKILSNQHLRSEVADYLTLSPDGRCPNCPQGAIGEWDVSRVTDMSELFSGAHMFNGDISKWDVSHVTSMDRMFMGAKSFECDLSSWDVTSVTNMRNMFSEAKSFKGDMSKWDAKVSSFELTTADAKEVPGFDSEYPGTATLRMHNIREVGVHDWSRESRHEFKLTCSVQAESTCTQRERDTQRETHRRARTRTHTHVRTDATRYRCRVPRTSATCVHATSE